MKIVLVGSLLLCMVPPAQAQQPEASSSLQRVRVSLQNTPIYPTLTAPPVVERDRTKIGILTLVPPERAGEIIRVSLPIGDLVTRAARTIGRAKYRRAERKAREDVQRVMREFDARPSR